MPDIIKRKKALSVSPLKASSTVGAALAFLGFNRAIPMLHGSQGCSAFGKILFVRHFREPIPLQTTAIDQVSAIMGSEAMVVEGLKTLCEKNAPELIGVPTTGLVETQGADIQMAVRVFRQTYPQFDAIPVVAVSTPDFTGSMESGYAEATPRHHRDAGPDRRRGRYPAGPPSPAGQCPGRLAPHAGRPGASQGSDRALRPAPGGAARSLRFTRRPPARVRLQPADHRRRAGQRTRDAGRRAGHPGDRRVHGRRGGHAPGAYRRARPSFRAPDGS